LTASKEETSVKKESNNNQNKNKAT